MYVYNLPHKFRRKQCNEYKGISIPLKYLLYKEKTLLEPILDIAEEVSKEIVVEHKELSRMLEDLLQLSMVAVHEIQQLLGELLDLLCVKKTFENIMKYYRKDKDRAIGLLHSHGYIRKRLPKFSVRRVIETICTNTKFCLNVTYIDGYNQFQLFQGKISKFLCTVPLKPEKMNYEVLEKFIA